MVLCEYCRTQFFESKTWRRGDFKPHHATADTWRKSLADRCGICTFLANHVARAIYRHVGKDMQYAFERGQLQECLDLVKDLPLYRVRYHPRNVRGQVYIGFEPVFQAGIRLIDVARPMPVALLSRQSFIAYTVSAQSNDHTGGKIKLSPLTDSYKTFEQIRKWLSHCDANHITCRHSQQDPSVDKMPKRLIDVRHPPRLVNSRDVNYSGPYMTLSHCWGPPAHKPLEHRTYNSAQLYKEILWDQLPETFKHAIEVTRRVGRQYIWIDSLCIHQGYDGDFLSEGARMDLIYGRSYCNIAAVHASDSRYGLFSERNPDELEPLAATAFWEGYKKDYHIVRSDYWTGKLLSTVLYSRGWVFQERMLSPRIIHFTKQEVMWQCGVNAASENFPDGLPTAINFETSEESRLRSLVAKLATRQIDAKKKAALDSIWKTAAENYSRLNLTNERDKIFALSGLAKIIGGVVGEGYHAGLWDYDFVEQLTWRIRGCRAANGELARRCYSASGYVAPSWSWLSMFGLTDLRDRAEQDRLYELELVDEHKTAIDRCSDDDIFGMVNSAQFQAYARMYELRFRLDDLEQFSWIAVLPDDEIQGIDGDLNTENDADDAEHAVEQGNDNEAAAPDASPDNEIKVPDGDLVEDLIDEDLEEESEGSEESEADLAWVKFFPDEIINLEGVHGPAAGEDDTLTFTAIMLVYSEPLSAEHAVVSKQGYMLAVVPYNGIDTYKRLGLIEFRDLDEDMWVRLERCRIGGIDETRKITLI